MKMLFSDLILLFYSFVITSNIYLCHGDVIPLHSRRFKPSLFNLRGQAGEGYYLTIAIGTPPQTFNVLVDTGSSNFAIACYKEPMLNSYFHSNESKTFVDSGKTVFVPYTEGHWTGVLGVDLIKIPSFDFVNVTGNVACMLNSSHFYVNNSAWQGILGLGYQKISKPNGEIEPLFDSLVKKAGVPNSFSMQLCGARAVPNEATVNLTRESMNGTMLAGNISSQFYKGKFFYTPIYKETFYEVIIVDIKVDNVSLSIDCKEYNYDKSVVDSGTTNIRFPDRVYSAVVEKIKSGISLSSLIAEEFWRGIDVLCWKELSMPYLGFPPLTISFLMSNNTYFEMILQPQQYLRPVQVHDEALTGYCFKFGIQNSSTGTILGVVLMEGFYVHFDRENEHIGFAETTCPQRDPPTALHNGTLTGPHKHIGPSLYECAYIIPEKSGKPLVVVAYIMGAICLMCVLPLIVMLLQYQVQKCRRNQYVESKTDLGSLIPK